MLISLSQQAGVDGWMGWWSIGSRRVHALFGVVPILFDFGLVSPSSHVTFIRMV